MVNKILYNKMNLAKDSTRMNSSIMVGTAGVADNPESLMCFGINERWLLILFLNNFLC